MTLPVLKTFINAAVPIYEAIRDRTSTAGMTPQSKKYLEAAAAGAKAAGLADLKIVAAAGGGHLSHGRGTEWDLVGVNPDGSPWTTKQRIQVAEAARAAGADRFGIYDMSKGTGAGTLHMGYSGPGRPAAVWGAGGKTSGEASHNFTDPSEKAFLVSYNEGTPLKLPDTKPTSISGGPGIPTTKAEPGPQLPGPVTASAMGELEGAKPTDPAVPPPEIGSAGAPAPVATQPLDGPVSVAAAGGLTDEELFHDIKDETLVDVLKPPPPIEWGDTPFANDLTMADIFDPQTREPWESIVPPPPVPTPFEMPEIAAIPRAQLQRLATLKANFQEQRAGMQRIALGHLPPFGAKPKQG